LDGLKPEPPLTTVVLIEEIDMLNSLIAVYRKTNSFRQPGGQIPPFPAYIHIAAI
jgi:hypothetical protein